MKNQASREPVRCALVGLGRIGSILEEDPLREKPATHAGAIQAHPDCKLVAGCDRDGDRCAAFAVRWKVAAIYRDLRTMLGESQPDLLHIATPPEHHLEAVRCAVAQRVPVVVCEKPLAPTRAEAMKLVSLARRGGVRVMVNHERRFCVDWRHVRSVIQEKPLGDLESIRATLYMGEHRRAGEMLLDDGTHLIDALRFITGGEFKRIRAWGDARKRGGTLWAAFTLAGIPGVLEVGGGRDHFVFEAELSFARGRVRVGNGVFEQWESRPSPHYRGARSLALREDLKFPVTGYFANMVSAAVGLVRDPKAPIESKATDGLAAVSIIEKILGAIQKT
ncbi:MAG: Gfo/Idh/MocA family oxidoreductase [Spirochaetes bacterium]|nr:Gfo/Idh/MocA family oxidoreductase [Spirochaetota bacterium]